MTELVRGDDWTPTYLPYMYWTPTYLPYMYGNDGQRAHNGPIAFGFFAPVDHRSGANQRQANTMQSQQVNTGPKASNNAQQQGCALPT